MRVLVVEDDPPLASFICKGLQTEGYVVDMANDGEEASQMSGQSDYDLLVLDLNIPKGDGTTVLRELRAKNSTTPVLVLTARNSLEDRVAVLDMGADDYLVKPFSFSELSARLRALLRRHSNKFVDSTLRFADLEMNRVERIVCRAGRRIDLTSKEFSLLEYHAQQRESSDQGNDYARGLESLIRYDD
ncbi:MAG: putative two-component response regulator [Acidobacteriales bacterium]|nr:putative two-component response regulator [Terriglobales bacterium]